MADHGSSENGTHSADGHIGYKVLENVFTEAVNGFAHVYAYGVSKVTFISTLTGRTIHNLKQVNCPSPPTPSTTNTGVPCHATNSPNFLAKPILRASFTIYAPSANKEYVKFPPDMTRHIADFIEVL